MGAARTRPVAHAIEVHSKEENLEPLTLMVRSVSLLYLQFNSTTLHISRCYLASVLPILVLDKKHHDSMNTSRMKQSDFEVS